MGCATSKASSNDAISVGSLQLDMSPGEMPSAPEMWGLTVQQLYDFALLVYGGEDELVFAISEAILPDGILPDPDAPPLAMYDVVNRHVKPITAGTNLSLAVLLNRHEPKRASVFLSHSWGENFAYFVYLVCRELVGELSLNQTKMTPRKDGQMLGFGPTGVLPPDAVVWCCALAIDQNADIQAAIGDGGPSSSPFAKVLQQSDEVLVVHNKTINLYSRVWCVYEMHLALQTQAKRVEAEEATLQLRSVGMLKDEAIDMCIRFIKEDPSRAEAYNAVEKLFEDKGMQYLSMNHAWAIHEVEENHKRLDVFQNTVASALTPLVEAYVEAHPVRVRDARASVEADRLSIMGAIDNEGVEETVDTAVSKTMVGSLQASISLKLRADKWQW